MTTEYDTRLPLDDKIDAIVAANESGDTEALAAATLAVGDAQRFMWGMGRALQRLTAQHVELQDQLVMVGVEIREHQGRLMGRMKFFEAQLEVMMLERRKSGAGNFLDIPGVGRWSTKEVKAGWDIVDPKVVMDGLGADERAQFVENTPKLKGAEYRKYLEETGEVVDGVERRPERISVSYKLTEGSE